MRGRKGTRRKGKSKGRKRKGERKRGEEKGRGRVEGKKSCRINLDWYAFCDHLKLKETNFNALNSNF